MALTVFTAADQTVGPVHINRDRAFSYRVGGTLTAGSTVILEVSRIDEDSYSHVQTFTAATTAAGHHEHYSATRGWKFRLRCGVFTGPDTPSGEIVCI